jgi:hypothetical protein
MLPSDLPSWQAERPPVFDRMLHLSLRIKARPATRASKRPSAIPPGQIFGKVQSRGNLPDGSGKASG